MAKKSKVAKHERQQALVEKYAELRRTLKAEGRYDELRKLPRDSSPSRLHNRCELTGRPTATCVNLVCRGFVFVN